MFRGVYPELLRAATNFGCIGGKGRLRGNGGAAFAKKAAAGRGRVVRALIPAHVARSRLARSRLG